MTPYPYGITFYGKPIAWFAREEKRDECLHICRRELRTYYGAEFASAAKPTNPVHQGSDRKEAP